MALRYELPVDLRGLQVQKELKVVPRPRAAAAVEFRVGANLKRVAEEVLSHVDVEVNAAPGAGKSSLLPKELALVGRKLVFLVLPHPRGADANYRYAAKMANEEPQNYPVVVRWSGYDQELPRIGLVVISVGEFAGLMGLEKSLVKYNQCVVFLDEAHQSNGYTHVVRSLSLAMGAGHFVKASATFTPAGHRKSEAKGVLVEKRYDPMLTPETWDVTTYGMPWSVANLRDAALIFTDSRSTARALVAKYRQCGVHAYHLTSKTTAQEFAEAELVMNDKKAAITVYVVDSSYRDSFNFPVTVIIDTLHVGYIDMEKGRVVKKSRMAYEFEAYQAANRGGRFPGLRTVYYRPDVELEQVICDLETVEREAAAYFYKVIGFRPDGLLADAVMAHENLPPNLDVVTTLNGEYPLVCWLFDSRGNKLPQVEGPVVQPFEGPKLPVELPNSGRPVVSGVSTPVMGSPSVVPVDGKRKSGVMSPGPPASSDEFWQGALAALGSADVVKLSEGVYYDVKGVGRVVNATPTFPRGYQSVLDCVTTRGGLARVSVLSTRDREYALSVALDAYNACNAEFKGVYRAMTSVFEGRMELLNQPTVKSALGDFFDSVARLSQDRAAGLNAVCVLAEGKYELVEDPGVCVAQESKVYNGVVSKLERLISKSERTRPMGLVRARTLSASSYGSSSSSDGSVSSEFSLGNPSWAGYSGTSYESKSEMEQVVTRRGYKESGRSVVVVQKHGGKLYSVRRGRG